MAISARNTKQNHGCEQARQPSDFYMELKIPYKSHLASELAHIRGLKIMDLKEKMHCLSMRVAQETRKGQN